jgi:hypothetical protein
MAIVTEVNAHVADVAALTTELGTLTTSHNALVAALQAAGVLAAI